MQPRTKIFIAVKMLMAWLCLLTLVRAAPAIQHNLYARLLSRHVHAGLVDYDGFKADEAMLDQYLQNLSQVDPDTLERRQAMAFYINLYNAWTIKLILTRYPDLKSIKDLGSLFGSPWKKALVRLNGQTVTLDHIEHAILRPEFKDPRVHFAINCASKGCPPLAPFPFTGDKLDGQLDRAVRAFINDPDSNYLDGNTLHVSRIFKWFGEDFNRDVLGFFRKYADDDLKKRLDEKKGRLRVSYLDYDWSLNRVIRPANRYRSSVMPADAGIQASVSGQR